MLRWSYLCGLRCFTEGLLPVFVCWTLISSLLVLSPGPLAGSSHCLLFLPFIVVSSCALLSASDAFLACFLHVVVVGSLVWITFITVDSL
ncbi:hypothetical protein BDE02_15G115300 [Populus trichocarpa]|nr:hypothetical protein BDE02_15G115300 [Populus trichocarpa]